jgi:hypothetical protein
LCSFGTFIPVLVSCAKKNLATPVVPGDLKVSTANVNTHSRLGVTPGFCEAEKRRDRFLDGKFCR